VCVQTKLFEFPEDPFGIVLVIRRADVVWTRREPLHVRAQILRAGYGAQLFFPLAFGLGRLCGKAGERLLFGNDAMAYRRKEKASKYDRSRQCLTEQVSPLNERPYSASKRRRLKISTCLRPSVPVRGLFRPSVSGPAKSMRRSHTGGGRLAADSARCLADAVWRNSIACKFSPEHEHASRKRTGPDTGHRSFERFGHENVVAGHFNRNVWSERRGAGL